MIWGKEVTHLSGIDILVETFCYNIGIVQDVMYGYDFQFKWIFQIFTIKKKLYQILIKVQIMSSYLGSLCDMF